jgi:hypothetical protein
MRAGPVARPVGPAGRPAPIRVEDFSIPGPDDNKPQAVRESDATDPAAGVVVEQDAAERSSDAALPTNPSGLPTAEVQFDFGPGPGGGGALGGGGRGAGGRPAFVPDRELVMILSIVVYYGFLLLAVVAMMLWWIWFGTKTMYVMPLIADRGCSFSEALTESWRLTKSRFWELMLVYLLASLISGLGVYVCYVGALATMPVYFTIIAATYDAHGLPQFTPSAEGKE